MTVRNGFGTPYTTLIAASHNGRIGDLRPRLFSIILSDKAAEQKDWEIQEIAIEGPNSNIRIMGLACNGSDLLVVAGSSEQGYLATFDDNLLQTGWYELPGVCDPHGLVLNEGRLLVISSGTNEVVEFAFDKKKPCFSKAFFRLESAEPQHLNGMVLHNRRLFVSALGVSGREAHEVSAKGYILDTFDGSLVRSGLDQPHSLVSHEGSLLFCESKTSTIWKNSVAIAKLSGYLRGLAISPQNQMLFVGESSSRPPREALLFDRPDAKLWTIRPNGEVVSKIELIGLGPEIHEILIFRPSRA